MNKIYIINNLIHDYDERINMIKESYKKEWDDPVHDTYLEYIKYIDQAEERIKEIAFMMQDIENSIDKTGIIYSKTDLLLSKVNQYEC